MGSGKDPAPGLIGNVLVPLGGAPNEERRVGLKDVGRVHFKIALMFLHVFETTLLILR